MNNMYISTIIKTINIMRKTTETEKEVFSFLNDLRDSGATNMFGATPFIMDEFNLDQATSKRLLSTWMNNFNKEGNYEEVKDA